MLTLTQHREKVLAAKEFPSQLAELHLEMAADYMFYQEKYAELEIKKAKFINDVKFSDGDKPLSDKACESKWILTKEGEQEVFLHRYLKGLEMMMRSAKIFINQKNAEAYNGV